MKQRGTDPFATISNVFITEGGSCSYGREANERVIMCVDGDCDFGFQVSAKRRKACSYSAKTASSHHQSRAGKIMLMRLASGEIASSSLQSLFHNCPHAKTS